MTFSAKTSRPRRHIVVNADDFGLSLETNQAILRAFDKALISSATIMAGMPAFEDACQLVHQHNLLGRIGMHLNLTSGRPLTGDIARSRNFCDESGTWLRPRKVFVVNRCDALALEAEIEAQYRACERQGITPTHWDSHHHMHTEFGIAPIVIGMAKRLGTRGIRLAYNCGLRHDDTSTAYRTLARVYQDMKNMRLRFHGLARTQYFGNARDTIQILDKTTADVEIMVHPKLDAANRLVDLDGSDLEARIAALNIPAAEMCSFYSL